MRGKTRNLGKVEGKHSDVLCYSTVKAGPNEVEGSGSGADRIGVCGEGEPEKKWRSERVERLRETWRIFRSHFSSPPQGYRPEVQGSLGTSQTLERPENRDATL